MIVRPAQLLRGLAVVAFLIAWALLAHYGTAGDSSPDLSVLLGVSPIIAAVGLAIIGYGGYQVWTAWTEKFAEKLDAEGRSGQSGRAYLAFGKAGYTAKGIAIGLVGGLFVYAAVTHDAQKSGGLDQALLTVLRQPYGPVLLGLIGLGLACYGLFTLARARHLSR